MKKSFLIVIAIIVGVCWSVSASGQILTFEFSALAGNETSANSNYNNPGISSSTITRGAGLTASDNGGRFNATSWALTSIANAISGNDYMEFTITPNSGYQFSVSSIYIQMQRSATGPSGIAIRSSVDGYASNLDQIYTVNDVTTTQNFTFTFSQSNSTTPVTYRIYMWAEADGGSGGIGDGAGNDIVITGTTSLASIVSTQSGNWSSTTTWVGGVVPTSADNATIKSGHTVTMDNATYSTRNSGVTTTVEAGGILATSLTYTNNGTTTINGTFRLVNGGWANGNNFIYGANGTLEFNTSGAYGVENAHVFWPSTNSPYNVSVLSGGLNLGSSSTANRTVNGIFQTSAGVTLSNSSVLTINGTCRINTGGWFNNAATYGSSSTLNYNTGTAYGRNIEWSSTTAGTPGYPYNVQVSGNTDLNPGANSGTNIALIIGGNLTVDSGSGFYADFGPGPDHMNATISVLGDLNIAGGFALSGNVGADFKVGGNITVGASATFNGNNRALIFIKTGVQTISSVNLLTIPYIKFEPSSGFTTIKLLNNLIISAPLGGNAIVFNSSSDVLDINNQTLSIGTIGVANTISGNGTIKGSYTSNLTLLGTGSIGTLNFYPTYENLATFTINRTDASTACVLGTNLTIKDDLILTKGIIDVSTYSLSIDASASITGGSSNSYIIADKTIGGTVKKFITAIGAHTFPIGDATSSADGTQYSPATINFTAGNFSSAYILLNVEDSKEENNEADVDYISRYWNLNGSGITSATYDFTGNFLSADINGTDSNSKSGRYAPSSVWTEGSNIVASSNTLILTGLTTATGAISLTANTNHYTAGNPLKKAEINVKQGASNYAHSSTYDFGNTEVNSNNDITFTIENLGLENLTLGSATVNGANYSLQTNYSSPVTGQSSTTFVIRFTPSSTGVSNGSISIPNNDVSDSENPYIINFTGTGIASSESDIVEVTSSEAASISSIINDAIISSTSDGIEVWKFKIRDGGADLTDVDNLPTIVTALTFSASTGNQVGTWSDAIQSIALFDGSTYIANGTVNASTIDFTGLNISVADNTEKTISVRLSLKNPLGADAFDGEDLVFGILNTNTTLSSSGSGKISFSVAASANSTNFIDVTATELAFNQEPQTTGINNTMSEVIVGGYDANGNLDTDFSASVSIISSGTMTGDPITQSASNGLASFTSIVHTELATDRELVASSSGLTDATSSVFDIIETTDLIPGDLAILAFNTNNGSGQDEISFVCFKDLTPGTIIDITDNAYQKCGTPDGWGISEGWVRLERTNTVLTKGTVITINVLNGTPSVVSPDPSNWNTSKPQPSSQGQFDLNNSGEQIFFMTGGEVGGTNSPTAASDEGTYSGYFLYGFNTKGDVWTPICGTSTEGGTKNSDKPYNFDCFLTWPTAQADLNKYTGLTSSATKREWLDRINDPNNWTGYADNTAYEAGPDYFGASITILDGGFSNGQWIGNNSTDWYDCGNWQSLTVPDETTDVFINSDSDGAVKIDYTTSFSELHSDIANCNNLTISDFSLDISGSRSNLIYVNGDLTITDDGSLDIDDSDSGTDDGIIYLYGDWNNNLSEAEFDEGQSLIVFAGDFDQDISLTTGTSEIFYEIEINKPTGDVLLNDNVEVSNLNLTDGLISTGVSNMVYLSNSAEAAITNHSTASYINGNLRRAVAATGNYDLPVGDATNYQLANIDINSSTGLTYFDANFNSFSESLNISGLGLEVNGTTLQTLLDAGYWTISPNVGMSGVNYDIGLTMRGATNLGTEAGQHTVVKRANSSSDWILRGQHDNATQNINAGVMYAYRSNIDEFSDFAIAKHSTNILPVELLSFTLKCNTNSNQLFWSTASELNNDYFEVQRSYDAANWEVIAEIEGAGNSNKLINYSFIDNKINQNAYYRLKQVDFDGKFEYSDILASKCIDIVTESIEIYPNPTQNRINLIINNWNAENIAVEIFDMMGKLIYKTNYKPLNGNIEESIDLSQFKSGIYMIRFTDNTTIRTLRIEKK